MIGANLYGRYSTDNQNGETIEVQIDVCSRKAAQLGIPVLGVYADYAVSGMKASRPQFDAMMDSFRARKADVLIIYDQSRLSRDMLNWFTFRTELMRLGVTIISATQAFVGGDIRDPSVFLQEGASALMNQMYVLQTRQKVISAMRYRATNGLHTGGVPALGYKVEGGKLVIDEEEAATVRRIFREYAEGRSYREIIDGLNDDGIRTKRGSKFGSNSLHDLMKNERYTGTIIYGQKVYRVDGSRNTHAPEGTDVIRIEDGCPAIIDRELFDAVQKRMAVNKHTQAGRPPKVREYPLKGKVFCGECGAAMTVARSESKGASYYYYRCSRKDRMHDCDCTPIRADRLEDIVVDYVISILGNDRIKAKAMDLLRREAGNILAGGLERYKALSQESAELTRQINNLSHAIAVGGYSEALNSLMLRLEAEREEIEEKMRTIHHTSELAAMPADRVESLFTQVMSAKGSRTAICSVVSRVEVGNEYIRVFTAFDPDYDPKKHTRPEDTTDNAAIEIDGTGSGVPKKQIPIRVSAFLVRLGLEPI